MADEAAPRLEVPRGAGLVQAPARAHADTELRLFMGMLMVLAGCGFHALCVMRARRVVPETRLRKRLLPRMFQTRLI